MIDCLDYLPLLWRTSFGHVLGRHHPSNSSTLMYDKPSGTGSWGVTFWGKAKLADDDKDGLLYLYGANTFPQFVTLAGSRLALNPGETKQLTITAVDAENDALRYRWRSGYCGCGTGRRVQKERSSLAAEAVTSAHGRPRCSGCISSHRRLHGYSRFRVTSPIMMRRIVSMIETAN